MAASVGAATLQVARRPRVALFSTGDELAMPGEPLKPGAIYNSNRFTLRGLIEAIGCDGDDLGIVPDQLDATRDALRAAAREATTSIVTCGGVSVGEEDHLKPAVQAEGRLDLWQIAIKPGQAAGVRRGASRRRHVGVVHRPAGQPGVELRDLPARRAAGAAACCRARSRAGAAPDRDARRLRLAASPTRGASSCACAATAAGGLELFPNQGSGVLTSMVWADGLVDNPPAQAIAPRRHGALPAAAVLLQ